MVLSTKSIVIRSKLDGASDFLVQVDNPEYNIEYNEEGRKAHQEELVNSVKGRL